MSRKEYSDEINALYKWALQEGIINRKYKIKREDITEHDGNIYHLNGHDYLVIDNEQAEDMFNNYVESLVEDLVYSELGKSQLLAYFDYERYERDIRIDMDRGGALSSYDGEEHIQNWGGIEFYIYNQG